MLTQEERPRLRRAPEPAPADLIPIAEAAELAGLKSVDTIRRWIKRGKLRAWRRLGLRYVSRAAVEAELEYVPEEPKF